MELSGELQAVAERDLDETKERKERSLAELERLLKTAEHPEQLEALFFWFYSSGATRSCVLLQYLRSRNFDAEKAFKALALRAAFHAQHPDLTENITGDEFLQLYERGLMCVLPGTDRHGRRIIMLRPSAMNSFPVDPVLIRWQVFAMTRLALDPHFQVNGLVLVMNFDSLRFEDAKHMASLLRSGRIRLMFHFIRNCAPARIGGIYMLHQPRFISIVWSLVSLFIGKKIRSRVRFLGNNLAALHEQIDPADLPPLLGGTLQQANPLQWLQQQIARQQAAAQVATAAKALHDEVVAGLAGFAVQEQAGEGA